MNNTTIEWFNGPSEYHVKTLENFLNDLKFPSTTNISEVSKHQLILKGLSAITNVLHSCYQQEFGFANNEHSMKFYKLLFTNQHILVQCLIYNDNFIVYLAKKLLTLLLLMSNKLIVDNIDVKETQRQLLEKICDLYIDKMKDVSYSTTAAVLEIYHSVLKDFRNRLSDSEHSLAQHAGCRLLNVLNERFEVETIMNLDDENNNLIIVPILAVILDIKKLEADEIENALGSHLMQVFQSLSEKVDSKIESICSLLCCRYLPAIRKVLDILHHTVESTNNIDMIFVILISIKNYTERILDASDVRKLADCLKLNNDHTEFFDRQKDNDVAAYDAAINIECIKELINVYMEVYISLMRLYMENNGKNMIEISRHISTDIKLRTLIDILTFSRDLLQQNKDSFDYVFNWYTNNDGDLASFMLNLVRLELSLKEFEKKSIDFDDKPQEKIIKEQNVIMECISSQMSHTLNYYTSHHFFLRLLISTGFNHSVLLDFLISNETIFLEFLLNYCKHLERDISQFLIICKKFDEKNSEIENCAEQVLKVFNNLTQSIQSSMKKNLFPYNATSLIKRIKKVELLLMRQV